MTEKNNIVVELLKKQRPGYASENCDYASIIKHRSRRCILEFEPPPMKWSAPMIRKAEGQRWPLRDPSPKRLS
jgi:hypothetical protein